MGSSLLIVERIVVGYFVSFKPVKCNNAYRFLSKTKNKQWHSHTIHREYLRNPEWKNKLRASSLSLFLSLY